MNTNLEIKVSLNDYKSVEEKLSKFKCESFYQIDKYIKYPHGRLKLREFDNGIKQLILYKRKDNVEVTESKFKIHTYKSTEKYTEALKNFTKTLGIEGEVRKERKYYRIGSCRVHLDKVKGLGAFLEIESIVKDENNIGQNLLDIKDILSNYVSMRSEDKIASSYIDLIKNSPMHVSS